MIHLLGACSSLCALLALNGDVDVGDPVGHTFRGEVWNAPGFTDLSQSHGRIVAVFTFDLDGSPATAKLVQLAAELHGKHAPHLHVFLAPRGVPDDDALLSTLLRERWLAHDVAWTREDLLAGSRSTGVRTVVVDPSGRVAAHGEGFEPREIERVVREAVETLESAIAFAPDAVMSAYRRMQKGEVHAAYAHLEALGAGKVDGVADTVRDLAAVAVGWWRPATHGRRDRIAKLLEAARFREARALMDELLEEFPGLRKAQDPFAEEVRGQLAVLETRAKGPAADERRADDDLEDALATLRRRGPSSAVFGKLERIAEKYSATRAAERSRKWLAWARAANEGSRR